jgi:hypothetical protein
MLIPAILLSGTAVDLARIHTAKSIAHNANQLAANSVLTEYNALLKDLYGLFGVAENDPVLADLVNEYIQVAVYGESSSESWIDTGLGSLQLFYGSTASAEIKAADGYNLGKADVLRRQIEEYMKFRGPVILVTRLLDALSIQGGSLKASNEAIKQQEVVGDGLLELFGLYRNLYDKIVIADECKQVLQLNAIDPISRRFMEIQAAFGDLKTRYATWDAVNGHVETTQRSLDSEKAKTNPDEARIEKLENDLDMYQEHLDEVKKRYEAKRQHIVALTIGGDWQDWEVGKAEKLSDGETDLQEWKPGRNSGGDSGLDPLQDLINTAKLACDAFKQNFTNVVTAAKAIDDKRDDVYRELNTLQQKVDDPNCDATLKGELQTQITECKALLDQFPIIEDMARNYQNAGNSYIDTTKDMLDEIKYRDKNNSGNSGLSISDLGRIASNSQFTLKEDVHADISYAKRYADYSDVTYDMPSEFKKFADINPADNSNGGLYRKLEEMAEGSSGFDPKTIDGLTDNSGSDDPETRQRNIIEQLVQLAKDAKDGLVSNPQGARRIEDSTVTDGSMGGPNIDAVINLISNPRDAVQEAANWALMMTYDTSMFSNYTTNKPANLYENGDIPYVTSLMSVPKTNPRTNIRMAPKVNYFYQSEWEYLLVGNKDAVTNLDKVRDLIYDIRLVCNTIAAFTVSEVRNTANGVKTAVSAIPYIGLALGVVLYFATFVAFAAAESAVDLVDLRNGCKVPLMKINGVGWICKPEGIADRMRTLEEGGGSETIQDHNDEKGISYEQYMIMFFLLTSDIDTLTQRTGKLIEWNVNNYQVKANKNNMNGQVVNTDGAVSAMSTAFADPKCFRLSKMNTDFDITTTVNLRLFFLTMPMFQQQGSPFSGTFPVKATDYRGY